MVDRAVEFSETRQFRKRVGGTAEPEWMCDLWQVSQNWKPSSGQLALHCIEGHDGIQDPSPRQHKGGSFHLSIDELTWQILQNWCLDSG